MKSREKQGPTVNFKFLKVLKNRDYALLWASGLISDTGTWMQVVVVGVLITEITGKASWGGLAATIGFLVGGLITPLGGVMADRIDRRKLLIWTSLLQACVAMALAITYVTGHISPLALVILVGIEGALNSFLLPARSAMLPDLVSKDQIVDATALGFASWNIGRTLGPLLAGLTIAFWDYTAVFAVNAVSFFLMATSVLFIRSSLAPSGEIASVVERLRAGVVGVSAEIGCRSAIQTIAITAVLISPFIALIPAMSQLVLGGEGVDTAHLVAAQGIGSVIGSLALPSMVHRFGHNVVLKCCLVMLALFAVALALSPNLMFASVCLLAMGACYASTLISLSTIVQLRAPAALRARVISFYHLALGVGYFVGSSVQGLIGDLIGVREVIATTAAIYLLIIVLITFKLPARVASLAPLTPEPAPAPR